MPSGRRSRALRRFAQLSGMPLREVKRLRRMGAVVMRPPIGESNRYLLGVPLPTPPRPRRRPWAEISAAAVERGKAERQERERAEQRAKRSAAARKAAATRRRKRLDDTAHG